MWRDHSNIVSPSSPQLINNHSICKSLLHTEIFLIYCFDKGRELSFVLGICFFYCGRRIWIVCECTWEFCLILNECKWMLTALEKTSRNLILECYHNQIHWRCGRYCTLVFPLLNLPSYIVWFKHGDPTLITMRDGASKNKKGETLSNKMSVMIVISSPPPSPHQVFWHVKWVVSNFYLTVNTVAFWPTPMLNWYQYQF